MTDVRVPADLWVNSVSPEGILELWRQHDGMLVLAGTCVADVRIEDALHQLTAPTAGRLHILVRSNSVVEPGTVIGRIDAV